MKLYRILGKRGRVTIPFEIRQRVGFGYNDVLSFTEQDDRTVIVKREKVCDDCRKNVEQEAVRELIDGMSASQLSALFAQLSKRMAGGGDAR